MIWYLLRGEHIRNYNDSLRYLTTPESIKSGEVIEQFYQSYIKPFHKKSGLKPETNPFILHEFKLNQRPKDLYVSSGKLTKHFILSPRLFELWNKYKLTEHVCFDGVILKNDERMRNDYLYCHFYQSMSDNIDFMKSLFFIKNRDSNEIINEVKIRNQKDYNDLDCLNTKTSGTYLDIAELHIDKIRDMDLFYLMSFSDTDAFISERLYEVMLKEKISGTNMIKFSQFHIRC